MGPVDCKKVGHAWRLRFAVRICNIRRCADCLVAIHEAVQRLFYWSPIAIGRPVRVPPSGRLRTTHRGRLNASEMPRAWSMSLPASLPLRQSEPRKRPRRCSGRSGNQFRRSQFSHGGIGRGGTRLQRHRAGRRGQHYPRADLHIVIHSNLIEVFPKLSEASSNVRRGYAVYHAAPDTVCSLPGGGEYLTPRTHRSDRFPRFREAEAAAILHTTRLTTAPVRLAGELPP